MDAKAGLSHGGKACSDGSWEEDAMKDTWTKEGGRNSKLDKNLMLYTLVGRCGLDSCN